MKALKLWIPAISMMLVSLISYIDRNTLALLAPTILAETGLSTEQYGYIIAAFSVAYMLANPLWGRWLDQVGLRTGMTAAVAFWTVASVAHAFARGFWSFTAARAALGFGEGATFPGGLRTVMQTLPRESRSKGVAVAYSGGSLGAIVTPILITPIAVRWGWRGAFWFTGLVGAAWLTMWWFVSRMRAVREKPALAADALEAAAPPRLFDRRLWAFISAYALGAMPLGFVLYIAAIYLKTRGLTQIEIGALLWIPPLGWEVGYFFWGWLTDRWVRSDAPMAVYRRLFAICTLFSVPMAAVTWIEPLWLLMTELFLAMFVTAGFIIVGVSYATRVFSTSHAGLIAGVGAGSWSAAVAIVMPVAGRLFDQQRYDAAFMFATCFPVIGFLGWLWLSRATSRA